MVETYLELSFNFEWSRIAQTMRNSSPASTTQTSQKRNNTKSVQLIWRNSRERGHILRNSSKKMPIKNTCEFISHTCFWPAVCLSFNYTYHLNSYSRSQHYKSSLGMSLNGGGKTTIVQRQVVFINDRKFLFDSSSMFMSGGGLNFSFRVQERKSRGSFTKHQKWLRETGTNSGRVFSRFTYNEIRYKEARETRTITRHIMLIDSEIIIAPSSYNVGSHFRIGRNAIPVADVSQVRPDEFSSSWKVRPMRKELCSLPFSKRHA